MRSKMKAKHNRSPIRFTCDRNEVRAFMLKMLMNTVYACMSMGVAKPLPVACPVTPGLSKRTKTQNRESAHPTLQLHKSTCKTEVFRAVLSSCRPSGIYFILVEVTTVPPTSCCNPIMQPIPRDFLVRLLHYRGFFWSQALPTSAHLC